MWPPFRQVVTVINEFVYLAFDKDGEASGVSLDISIVFFILAFSTSYGVFGQIFGIIDSLLTICVKMVVLNGNISRCININAVGASNVILRPKLFLTVINRCD